MGAARGTDGATLLYAGHTRSARSWKRKSQSRYGCEPGLRCWIVKSANQVARWFVVFATAWAISLPVLSVTSLRLLERRDLSLAEPLPHRRLHRRRLRKKIRAKFSDFRLIFLSLRRSSRAASESYPSYFTQIGTDRWLPCSESTLRPKNYWLSYRIWAGYGYTLGAALRARLEAAMLPTTFDALFIRHASGVPLNLMRALTQRESGFNPSDSSGPAWGLMQITEVVRNAYNSAYRTAYSRSDLLSPEVNVVMAGDLLKRIAQAYNKHPSPNMKIDWNNPEFVKLVIAGWNSGYSEGGGVGRVARYLEGNGIPVTHDNVFAYAAAAGATTQLQKSAKQAWQRSVVDLYFAEGGDKAGVGSVVLYALITLGVTYGVYRYFS
ncbi:MAG: transglycosylase SLT domain-containing protein [Deltaproteobacteria bacterium]|nr:transglycosylase SLT domain-containing protein [Deltaproteobacteria bacterium]